MAVSFVEVFLLGGLLLGIVVFALATKRGGERSVGARIGRAGLLILIFAIVVIAATAGPKLISHLRQPNRDSEFVRTLPIETTVEIGDRGVAETVSRKGYYRAGYAILDFGDWRLAVESDKFSGMASGLGYPVSINPDAKGSSYRSSGGPGDFYYTFDPETGAGFGEFCAVEFEVKDGVVSVGSTRHKFGDGHTVFFMNEEGAFLGFSVVNPPEPGQ